MATFFNQAALNLGGNQLNSNITEGQLLGGLTLTKTALSGDYERGGYIAYALTVANNGFNDVGGVSVTDDLGAFTLGTETLIPLTYVDGSLLFYENGAPATAPAVTVDSGVTFSNITVPGGGNVTLIYGARVNGFAPLEAGAAITNTVTLTGPEELTATAVVPVREGTALSIAKVLCPEVLTNSCEVTYTFVIQNGGNVPVLATDNLTLTDTFSPALSNVTVTLNGAALTEGTGYTYDEQTGEFATLNGALPVPMATFTRDEVTGNTVTTPGYAVVVVRGNIC